MYDCNATVNVCRSLFAFPAQKARGAPSGKFHCLSVALTQSDPGDFAPKGLFPTTRQ